MDVGSAENAGALFSATYISGFCDILPMGGGLDLYQVRNAVQEA